MPNYKKLYWDLFNSVSDAVGLLDRDKSHLATLRLLAAERDAKEAYTAAENKTNQGRVAEIIADLCEEAAGTRDPEMVESLCCALTLGCMKIRSMAEEIRSGDFDPDALLAFLKAQAQASAGDGCDAASPPGTEQ